MSSGPRIDRHDVGDSPPQVAAVSNMPEIEVEQEVAVRLLSSGLHWAEVDAEHLGPARPRMRRELIGIDE